MTQGLLHVPGTIQLSQFWPTGESDADTTKVMVNVAAGAFQFRQHSGAPFKVTHVFDNAKVHGKTVKPCIDKQGRIVVRLQGIDAPELHYMPQAAKKKSEQTKRQHDKYLELNEKYRQYLAETATIKLRSLLGQVGQDPVPCTVETAVDAPGEVFDTYGRFIGDILVRVAGQMLDVNKWLVQEGWAFPAFYNSMSPDEITGLKNAGEQARQKGQGASILALSTGAKELCQTHQVMLVQ